MYKVYYWLTTLLFLAMFIMAAWFVCLVAVNTTGELLVLPQMHLSGFWVFRCKIHHLFLACTELEAHVNLAPVMLC